MLDAMQLALQPDPLRLPLGSPQAAGDVTVANTGSVVDQYVIQIEGLDTSWWKLDGGQLSLFPGTETSLALKVRPPPGVAGGRYPFRIVATSVSSGERALIETAVEVEGKAAVTSRIRPQKVRGRRGRFVIQTQNVGTQPLEMTYSGYDTQDMCRLSFSPQEARLPLEETVTSAVTVQAKRSSLFGVPQTFKVWVLPEPRGHRELQEMLSGEFEHTPWFRSIARFLWWSIVLAALAAVVIAVLAAGPADLVEYLVNRFPDDVRELVRGVIE